MWPESSSAQSIAPAEPYRAPALVGKDTGCRLPFAD